MPIKFHKKTNKLLIMLGIVCLSCIVKQEQPITHTKNQLDSISKHNSGLKQGKRIDSLRKIKEIKYFESIAHIKNVNGLKGIDKERLVYLLDSLPILKLPIGDKESFFYNYPKTQESYYGNKSNYDSISMKFYYRDSIATEMSHKAYMDTQNQIKDLNKEIEITDLEILLDSTINNYKRGLPLKFIGVLQKGNNFTSLLYQPSQHYYNDSYKIITLNVDGEIIDMHGLTELLSLPIDDSIYTNDLNFIDKNGTIYIKRFIVYAKTESTSDYVSFKIYKTDDEGNILRYFNEKKGDFEKLYRSTSSSSIIYLQYEKGQIVNHRKQGEWQEITMKYDDTLRSAHSLKKPLLVEATYNRGLKDGIWKYYNLEPENILNINKAIEYSTTRKKKEYLMIQETYSNGVLQKRKDYRMP